MTAMFDGEGRPDQEVHLRDYLHVLLKRKWILLAIVLVCVPVATIRSLLVRPMYHATAQLMIEREAPNVIAIQQVAQIGEDYTDFYNTQYKVLQGRGLAVAVAERLRAWEHPEFGGSGTPGPGAAKPGKGAVDSKRVNAAASAIQGRIRIEPVKNSFLVNVHASAYDAELAAKLANTLAEQYIEQNLRQKVDTTKQAGGFLGEQSAEARRKLADAERALQRFNEANNVISLEERQAEMTRKLGELNSELARTRLQRQDLESRTEKLRELRQKAGGAAPEGVEYYLPQFAQNTAALRAELNALEAELSEQSKVYTAKHPKILALNGKIQALRQKLAAEVSRAVQGMRSEYEIAVKREETLLAQIRDEERQLLALNSRGLEHSVLKREVESNARIYEMLVGREKETGVLSGIRANNIRIVEQARVPDYPVGPNHPRAIALGLLVALVGGLGLVFFLEYLDDSIHDPDELRRYADVPFLGLVPVLEPKLKGERSRDLIALQEPSSVYAEAYRAVRTNLLFSSPDRPPRVLAVTSSGQQEGKTVTAVNLAVTVALSEKRVLLVDADMRKPRVHEIFGVDNSFGLSNLIASSSEVGLGLKATAIPNLMVLPSGPIPPNPSELLGSTRLSKLIGQLREPFDVVIFDCTPLIAVTDATVLATKVDGVILVIKSGATRRKIVQRTIQQLGDVQAKIIGAVLNQVNVKNSAYYHASYYAHYYGKKKDKEKGAGAAA